MSLRSLIGLVTLMSLGFTTFAYAQVPRDAARAQALFKSAFELYQAGQYDAAVLGFEEGLGLDPDNGIAHYYLAEAYARQDKMDLAVPHYEKTTVLAPASKEALSVRTRLPGLRRLAQAKSALKPWLGKWKEGDMGVFELKSSGDELVMVWHRASAAYEEWQEGEVFARGTVSGNVWEGKVGPIGKIMDEWKCFKNNPQNPMVARIQADGQAIEMNKGHLRWGFEPCRIWKLITFEQLDEQQRKNYTHVFRRIP